MAYTVAPINVVDKVKVVDPRSKDKKQSATAYKWWLAQSDNELMSQLLSTTEYLKRTNGMRVKQASVFARLFSGKPLYNMLATNSSLDSSAQMPIGRPTANVVYSCIDTLTSRITQDRPKPTFLTDGGMYKERILAKEANQFLQGEFYRTKAYDLMALAFRDAGILGDGLLKVFAKNKKICVERTLETELLTDYNDAYYGNPRQLIQLKLVDRSVFQELFPDSAALIEGATTGNVDSSPRSTETVSDQFIISEGWHLPSSEDAEDGRHSIVCSAGVIHDEKWDRPTFPFAKFGYNPNPVGWFSQGLAEILMPTQMEIYRNLILISQCNELMNVPRIMIDEMSKILETSFNNRIGSIIKYRNTPPQFVNAEGINPGTMQFVEWLIQNAYQMSGISALSAAGSKPSGLDSGEAIRSFDQIQEDRFAAQARRYQNLAPELSYLMIESGMEIVEEHGSYQTVYPGKDGTHEIDFKSIMKLNDTYVIQLFEESSLPKDPAGRQAKLSEMLAAGEVTNQEFRRLSNFPDLQQSDQLAAALEERILYSLDHIIENGDEDYDQIAPDPFILDPSDLATTLCVQYINKYAVTDLEEEKRDLLRNWFTQVQTLKQQANPPQPPMPMQGVAPGQPPAPGQAPGAPPIAPPAPSMAPTSGVHV